MVSVRPHMGVFALYVGLTVSGYSLARASPGSPEEELIRAIKQAEWSPAVRNYFAKARSRTGGVNPYWPKAEMLLEACLYLESGRQFNPRDEIALLRAIAGFPVSPAEKDAWTVAWVRDFPSAYGAVMDSDQFPLLWTSYLDVLQPRLAVFEQAATASLDSIVSVTGFPRTSLPDVVVIPNPLQAPEIADFVRRPYTIHVVVAEPRLSSMVHELLHDVLGPVVRSNKAAIVAHRRLLRPVLSSMMRMQYAWADDEESWLRVFEENMMRAGAIWLENERRSDEGDRHAESQASQGFIYVPALLRCLREKWQGPDRTAGFIEECLRACALSLG
ncbi:MAG: hypothetical protein ACM3WU_07875 [Bacillota bacterium]